MLILVLRPQHLPTSDISEEEDSLGQGNTRMGAEAGTVTEKR